MYCPECKKAGRTCAKSRSYEGAGESKERINICLSCTVPASRCSGKCAKVMGCEEKRREGPAPKPEVRERREKVRKLFEGGMTAVYIAKELGLRRVTVQNDVAWLRERGGITC